MTPIQDTIKLYAHYLVGNILHEYIEHVLWYCVLVMGLGNGWLWFAWEHQAITWIVIDLSSKVLCGINLKAFHKKCPWT